MSKKVADEWTDEEDNGRSWRYRIASEMGVVVFDCWFKEHDGQPKHERILLDGSSPARAAAALLAAGQDAAREAEREEAPGFRIIEEGE